MYRSLCIVALFALSASALTLRAPDPPTPAELKCRAAHNINPEDHSDHDLNPETALKNPETRCYAACILKENETLKEDGTLNLEYLDKTIPAEMPNRAAIIAAFTDCSEETGKNSCETAYKSAMCIDSKKVLHEMHH